MDAALQATKLLAESNTRSKMATSTPSEVENTLQRLSHHRGVRGVMILSNETGRVIKHTGAMLEGPPGTAAEEAGSSSKTHVSTSTSSGDIEITSAQPNGDAAAPMVNATVRKYADAVRRIVTSSREAVQGLDEKDTLRFLRMRTGQYEMMITPEEKYTLVVFHDPNAN